MRKKISLLYLIFWCTINLAQPNSPFIQKFTNKEYGKKSNPEIYCVLQNQENSIIAGTSNGVLVYNGHQWDFTGVKEGYVTALAKTSSGKIMLGAVGEFGELQKKGDGSYVYKSYSKKLNLYETVWKVHCIGEKSYFQTETNLYVFENGEQIASIKAETTFHISFLVNSKILIRQRDKGLFELQNNRLVLIDSSAQMKSNGVFAVFENQGKLHYFFRDENSTIPYEKSIYGGIRLKDNKFLIYTLQDGIYILDSSFKIINHISQQKGLSDNDIKNAYQAQDGNIWLGTNNGLSLIEYQSNLSFYNRTHGIEGDVQDVAFNDAQMFVASSKGLLLETENGFENTGNLVSVWDILLLDKRIIYASSDGIFEWKKDKTIRLLNGNFNNIEAINGKLILAGPTGVTICDEQFNILHAFSVPISRSLNIYNDTQTHEIWIGTVASGVIRLFPNYTIDIYNDMDGLNTAWVKPMKSFENKLVFATKDGMQRFVPEEEVKASITEELRKDSSNYRGFFETIGSADEISSMFYFNNKKIVVIENEIKYVNKNTYVNSPYTYLDFGRINQTKEFNGSVFICTSEGLLVLEKGLTLPQTKMEASIQSILIHKKLIDFSKPISLTHDDNDIFISFQSPFYLHGSLVSYRSLLEGYDDTWTDYSSAADRSFNNLREGTYTFKLQAKNSLGYYSQVVSYTFSIQPPWYRTVYAYVIYFVGFICFFLFSIKLSRKHLQKKNDALELIVKERTSEIVHQKDLIEEKHSEITNSINYAERIQSALMTNEEHWQGFSKNHFILFRPRDVVSGDFYWAYQNDEHAIWAAADCTGHGVPGAFMSMLGISFLNEIVIEGKQTQPAQILNALRSKIIKSLEQKGGNNERKDGMDIALCSLNKKTNVLTYAGANNPLILITKNEEKAKSLDDAKMLSENNTYLVTLTANKMPVGKYVSEEKSFTQHDITMEDDDMIYCFSDGFQDQFGGVDGKKFMIKRFKQELLHLYINSVPNQKEALNTIFENWLITGNTEQIDDVCVVAIRF